MNSPEHQVFCGVCRAGFAFAYEKAGHLVRAHGARVEKHIDAEGNDIYVWRTP